MILGYHRIAQSSESLDEICVSPENFAEQLQELRNRAHPIRLSELVQHMKDGSLPDRSVAVTFDDGYADNLYTAKPLLEKYDIPATVFVCTGYMGKEFWWDELDRLVAGSQADPGALQLRVGEGQFEWRETNVRREGRPSTSLKRLRRALYQFLLSLDRQERDRAMSLIRGWSGVSPPGSSAARAMSEAELLRLADGGLIEIGAHTRHHPILPELSLEAQKEEIQSGKADLEAVLGREVVGFSYPNGRATAEVKGLVREMGFRYACASLRDVVRPGSDLFDLSRFWQEDVNGEKLAKRLNRWLN
jgi:peptidoglycan/xylan/chitin deacetylase (PgdA/CDA1 family)